MLVRSVQHQHLKLSQKALILIAVPLAFELAFVSALFLSIKQLSDAYYVSTLETNQLMLINSQMQLIIEAMGLRGMSVAERTDRYDQQISNTLNKAEARRQQLEAVKDKSRHMKMFLVVVDEFFVRFEKVRHAHDAVSKLQALARIKAVLNKLSYTSGVVIDEEISNNERQFQQQAVIVSNIERAVFAGVAMNILIAVGMIAFFNVGATRRLKSLIQNISSFATGGELARPLNGSDEFAQIDRFFRKAAGDLNAARRREQALVENAAEIICSLDAKGIFVKVNQAVTSILGYTADEVVGSSIVSLAADVERANIEHSLDHAISSGQTVFAEIRMLRKDHEECDVGWSMRWSETDKTFFCVAHDISERKRAEHLRQNVLSMVSHDLRAPLSSIEVLFHLLQEGKLGELTERGTTKVSQAQKTARRLNSLINDLIEVDRIRSSQFVLNYSKHLAKTLFDEAIQTVSNLSEDKHITCTIADNSAEVWCDGVRMHRVLTNLLDNAIKHSPAGGTVFITASHTDAETEISIRDSGPGISSDELASVFEPFKQVGTDDMRKQGSGLGLAICKAIVEAHHGTIGVQSEPGKGSSFFVRLPFPTD